MSNRDGAGAAFENFDALEIRSEAGAQFLLFDLE
jgi:hypothetical protein